MPPLACNAGNVDFLAASQSSAGHLPALLAGCAVMGIVNLLGGNVATIGSQFHYVLADGTQGNGIPQLLPQLMLPWSGSDFTLSWDSLRCCQRPSR